MISVSFSKSETPQRYDRQVVFPDGQELLEKQIEIPAGLYTKDEVFPWEKKLYELPENQLVAIGQSLAELGLGKTGLEKFIEMKRKRQWAGIQIIESTYVPELASIPWELMNIDSEFVALNPRTPVCRTIETYKDTIKSITVSKPIRMALISAMPSDQNPLMIEGEQIRFALLIGHLMASGKLEVHEINNCSRAILSTALQNNNYDILYFTGHGAYVNGMGYLCLEKDDKSRATDPVSSLELARMIPVGSTPRLVFLNCCQSGAGDPWNQQVNAFRDLGRELIKNGVPDVLATLTSVFDEDSQIFMQAFFPGLLHNYNVAYSVAKGRQALKEKDKNTFYQYMHLCQTVENPQVDYVATGADGSISGQLYASMNHPSPDMKFVGRHYSLSQIEASYRNGAKAVMVSGIGGIGKTALSAMLEKRLLTHYDPGLRVEKTVWLDLREEITLGRLIEQISNILSGSGNQMDAITLKNLPGIDPLIVGRFLMKTLGGKVLLTLDNCETLLDSRARPKDVVVLNFIIALIAHTTGWKALLTTREPFDLTYDNRTLFITYRHILTSLTYTERAALLDRLIIGYNMPFEINDGLRQKIIKEVGGNPYELDLFIRNLTSLSDIDDLIRDTHRQGGEYAYLDHYVGKLDKASLDLLQLLSVFRTPPSQSELEAVAGNLNAFKKYNVGAILGLLVGNGLVENLEGAFSVPAVLALYLTGGSHHSIGMDIYNEYSTTVTQVYYTLYKRAKEIFLTSMSGQDSGIDRDKEVA